jgi:hypothetical protein
VNTPEPSPDLFAGKVLFVGDANFGASDMLRERYAQLEPQGTVVRERNGRAIETYRIDLAEGLKGDPLDRTPPPELRR